MNRDRFRLKGFQGLRDMGAVNIGDKVHLQVAGGVRRQGFAYHGRAKIRPADADIDNIGKRLVRIAATLTAANGFRKLPARIQHCGYIRHHIAAVAQYRVCGVGAQGRVQHGPVLSAVDFFSSKHFFNPAAKVARARKLQQDFNVCAESANFWSSQAAARPPQGCSPRNDAGLRQTYRAYASFEGQECDHAGPARPVLFFCSWIGLSRFVTVEQWSIFGQSVEDNLCRVGFKCRCAACRRCPVLYAVMFS